MICAIVLAAGRSRRMGRQKLLLPFAGSTVIARVVDAFLGAPVDQTILVARNHDPQLLAALGARAVLCVPNPDPDGDMLSSVRCGLRALPDSVEIIFVCPGDLPAIGSALIRQMLAAFRAGGRPIVVPVHSGRRGHPLLFASRFREELLTAFDGTGLRGLLSAHPQNVLEWPTSKAGVLEDLDTPMDYERALN
jgi:molybdenum cofactor cytidylyltransferase